MYLSARFALLAYAGGLLLAACANQTPAPPQQVAQHTVIPDGESVAALNAIANDPSKSREVRAKAIFALFAYHISPGASSAEAHKVLTDTGWLKESDIQRVDFLAGWIPIQSFNGSIFSIDTLPQKNKSLWTIYFRLTGKVSTRGAIKFLNGQKDGTTLAEFALCFSLSAQQDRCESFSQVGGLRIEKSSEPL